MAAPKKRAESSSDDDASSGKGAGSMESDESSDDDASSDEAESRPLKSPTRRARKEASSDSEPARTEPLRRLRLPHLPSAHHPQSFVFRFLSLAPVARLWPQAAWRRRCTCRWSRL